jgi:predicted GIY-YIG superfamily endonuclease
VSHAEQTYVGFTEDISARLKKHNEGGNASTAPYQPWEVIF